MCFGKKSLAELSRFAESGRWRFKASMVFARWMVLLACLGNVSSLCAGSAGAEANAPARPNVSRAAEIEAALAEAIARAQASSTNSPVGMSAQDTVVRRGLLQRLVRIYQQQLSNLAELEATKRRGVEVATQARDWTGFTEPRPYSILLADQVQEAIHAEKERMAADEEAASTLDRLAAENREILNRAEEKIRLINEQLESVAGSAQGATLSAQRDLEKIRSQVSLGSAGLLDLERQIRVESLAVSRALLQLLQRQLIVVKAATEFTQSDLDKVLIRLDAERLRLEQELAQVEKAQLEAGAPGSSKLDPAPSAGAFTTDAAGREAGVALANLRAAQEETAATAVRVLRLLLEAGNTERTLWELRFAAYKSRQVAVLRQSERRLESISRRVALWKSYYSQKLESSSAQVALQENRLNHLESESPLLPIARANLATLQERDQRLLSMYRYGEHLERLLHRWNEDLRRDMVKLPFTDRVRNAFSDARSLVHNLWTLELFTAEDTVTVDGQKISGRRSVTVGKILGAILILVIGYWVTGFISNLGTRLLQKWLKMEPHQGQLIRRWLRATLVVCLVLFSLVSVKIPLTIFAFAGGALAIGVGFGMQTILKNVVSGLIILFERPFRVGDVLNVGGQKGTLTSIGLRASVLQLWDGTETLFPNSNLLENALTNWTYSNRIVRFSVAVGVAYGSDTRRVVQLLEEIVARHGLVEAQPKPQVFFNDFGPSSLVFELRFWLDVLKANAAQVSSDLRHMIAGTFAQNEIVIAFPQQDLHLQSARPLQVEVLPARALSVASSQEPPKLPDHAHTLPAG